MNIFMLRIALAFSYVLLIIGRLLAGASMYCLIISKQISIFIIKEVKDA